MLKTQTKKAPIPPRRGRPFDPRSMAGQLRSKLDGLLLGECITLTVSGKKCDSLEATSRKLARDLGIRIAFRKQPHEKKGSYDVTISRY